MRPRDHKLVITYTFLDPVTNTHRRGVALEDYAELLNYALKLKAEAKPAPPVLTQPAPSQDLAKVTAVLGLLRERLNKAEASLWQHSDGRASYFDEFPDAVPQTVRTGSHRVITRAVQDDTARRILGQPN